MISNGRGGGGGHSRLTKVIVTNGRRDFLPANVANEASAGARHLIATVVLEKLLPTEWTWTRSNQCQRHGLLDLRSAVRFVLAFHLIASYARMVFLSALRAGFVPARRTVKQLRRQGIGPDRYEVTFRTPGDVFHVRILDDRGILQLVVLLQYLFRQGPAQLSLPKAGRAVRCHAQDFQRPRRRSYASSRPVDGPIGGIRYGVGGGRDAEIPDPEYPLLGMPLQTRHAE